METRGVKNREVIEHSSSKRKKFDPDRQTRLNGKYGPKTSRIFEPYGFTHDGKPKTLALLKKLQSSGFKTYVNYCYKNRDVPYPEVPPQKKLLLYTEDQTPGIGVKAAEDIPMNSVVCVYSGLLLAKPPKNKSYSIEIFTHPQNSDEPRKMYLDAMKHGNIARFANHSCSDFNVIYEQLNDLPYVQLVSTEAIPEGRAITIRYCSSSVPINQRYQLIGPCLCSAQTHLIGTGAQKLATSNHHKKPQSMVVDPKTGKKTGRHRPSKIRRRIKYGDGQGRFRPQTL